MEVQLGQMTQQKGSSQEVKDFGARMAADDELKQLARQKGETMPGKLEAKLKSKTEALTKLSGGDFDKKYMYEMVKDHNTEVQSLLKHS